MRNNILTAHYREGELNTIGTLYQWDYGQRIVFEDIDLPQSYEVHFSNNEHGESITQIGDETGVDIPDELLQTGKNIVVWIYLHTGTDDGETVYRYYINVRKRAEPVIDTPTPVQQNAITQAIAALNVAVEDAQGYAGDAAESAADAETAKEFLENVSATAETLPAGSSATAQYAEGVFSFGVPKGDPGDPAEIIDDTAGAGDTDKAWSADKLTGEFSGKADRNNTVLDGSLSRGRKTGTNTGTSSIAYGYNTEATDSYSVAIGNNAKARANNAVAVGEGTVAAGKNSTVTGKYNVEDAPYPEWAANTHYNVGDRVRRIEYVEEIVIVQTLRCNTENTDSTYNSAHWDDVGSQGVDSKYVEIIGNGTAASRSNARVLDWDGTERLKGDLYVNCNEDSTGGNKAATETYVGTYVTGQKGNANGIAELDANGLVPSAQLPSYVDDVLEYANKEAFPATGETGKIYVALNTNLTYRWSGSAYVEISPSLALGETDSTAYRGDRGAVAYAAAVTNVDTTPTENSTHLITSGGVKAAIPDITGKADKVANATSGNFAALDGNGNLTDSGHKHSDYLTEHQDISGKADKVVGGTSDNFAGLDANGNLKDSGKNASDFTTPTDLANGLATKAPVIEETIDTPASVMTFDDGADSIPMSIEVAITPVQDLHGQDSPYPGGGNVNLADLIDNRGIDSNGVVIEQTGRTATVNPILIESGVSYVFKAFGSASSGGALNGIIAVFNGSTLVRRTSAITPNSTLDTSGGDKFYFCVYGGVAGTTVNVADAKAMIVKSTATVTEYSPYSNICPITGWTGAKVTRTGKNLVDKSLFVSGGIRTDNGEVQANNARVTSGFIKIQAGNQYSVSVESGKKVVAVRFYNSNKIAIGSANVTDNPATAPQDALYMRCVFGYTDNSALNPSDVTKAQVEEGTTATDYEPFGQTYPITFPNPPGTVYGGTLKVNKDGTGVLVVDKTECKMNTLTWHYESGGDFFWSNSLKTVLYKPSSGYSTSHGIISSDYKTASFELNKSDNSWSNVETGTIAKHWNGGSGDVYIYVKDTRYGTDATAFAEAMANVQLCYNLATHVTYTLTAEQILSLYGVNNVWADTGDVLSITYSTPNDSGLSGALSYGGKVLVPDDRGVIAVDEIAVTTETVSGTTPTITGVANHRYICGEVSTISITPPDSGMIDVVFTSGTTAAVLTLPNTVKMPEWFSVEASKTYEINILDGTYGVVSVWA